MPLDSAWNMYIFRDGKTTVRGAEIVDRLIDGLLSFPTANPTNHRTELLDLLLRAGELECALADCDPNHADLAAGVTDRLANTLVSGIALNTRELARTISTIRPAEQYTVTTPEGFAYYALHPLDFADLIRSTSKRDGYAAVVGIRSIGTSLSAVVNASLRADGIQAERITVRPHGHPYDRRTSFNDIQQRWITAMQSREADFFVVDEGPGMSGSSFLSVGDALLSLGVHRSKISFLGSRRPSANALTAPQAGARWPAFRAFYTSPTRHLPKEAKIYIAGGIWREGVFSDESEWPASWLQMEHLKFLSSDRQALFKFEGLGRFGAERSELAGKIASGGFGPAPLEREEGFGVYAAFGRPVLSSQQCSVSVLKRMAEYCAFRSRAMQVALHSTPELQTMLRFNTQEEFGVELPEYFCELRLERPVIADGRMLPHKWIDVGDRLLKVDAVSHGNDHFFPGPTDIAWDLAGTIVEWDLDYAKAQFFLDCYQKLSNDRSDSRLPAYLLAYSVFRMAYCKMAAAAMRGAPEEIRLSRGYHHYRSRAQHYIDQVGRGTHIAQRPLTGSQEAYVA
jgi:hypothetical protein